MSCADPRFFAQLSKTNRVAVVPRSGYGPKPRVALSLGEQVHVLLNPERVAPVDATALRLNRPFNSVTQGSRSGNPGL